LSGTDTQRKLRRRKRPKGTQTENQNPPAKRHATEAAKSLHSQSLEEDDGKRSNNSFSEPKHTKKAGLQFRPEKKAN